MAHYFTWDLIPTKAIQGKHQGVILDKRRNKPKSPEWQPLDAPGNLHCCFLCIISLPISLGATGLASV